MTRCLLFKQLLETLQVVNVDVGYRPVSEIAVAPMDQVIASVTWRGLADRENEWYLAS